MANTAHTPESFYAKVEKQENGCWVWQGSTNGRGYGQLGYQGKRTTSHRLSYELSHGPIPEGMVVRHTCDNPPCCNPAHLVIGTHQDNSDDKMARGRGRGPAGTPSINPTYKTVTELNREKYGECPNGHILTPNNSTKVRGGQSVCSLCYYTEKFRREKLPLTSQEESVITTALATIKALLITLPDDFSKEIVLKELHTRSLSEFNYL